MLQKISPKLNLMCYLPNTQEYMFSFSSGLPTSTILKNTYVFQAAETIGIYGLVAGTISML